MSGIVDTKSHMMVLISELKDNLERICVHSEQGFLTLGNHLQSATREGKSVSQKVTEIITLAESELGQDVLGKITNLITLASDYFKDQREAIGQKSLLIKRLIEHLSELRLKNAEIERMAKYLRAVALNIFIETSRSQSLSDNFSIIANEIKQLSETILSLSKTVRENVSESEDRFFVIDRDIVQGIHDLGVLTEDAKNSFYDAMIETDQWLQNANDIAHKNGIVSKQIIDKVGDIVMSLQFQDSMRQRLEHITASLTDMHDMAKAVDEKDKASHDSLAMVFELSALLTHQIDAIIQEAHDVSGRCARSFDTIQGYMVDIEGDVKAMMQKDLRKSKGIKQNSKSKNQLNQTLHEFTSVKQTGDQLVDRIKIIYNMASEISSSLENQVGQIHQISMDAHIKALNAIIAAIHLGDEGKTLSVLAGEMKGLSDLTDTLVREINSILVELVAGSRVEDMDTQNLVNDYGKTLEDMSQSLPELIGVLADRFRDLKKDMNQVGKTHELVRDAVTFIPGVAQDLSRQKDILAMIKDSLESYRKYGVEGQHIHSQIEERYTMEKERAIHRKSIGKEPDSPQGGHGLDVDVEEDLGDNIELF